MPSEQNRSEKERVLSRLVSNDSTNFGIMFVLLAMIGSQMYFGQILGKYQFPIFIFLFIIFVFSSFRMIQNRKLLKQYFEPNAIGVDPILILSGLGIDIYGYSENLLVTCSDLHKRLDAIGDHITDLNVKIQTTGKDIDRVYQIVSQLASEEVKLMEAVGKTSEEINIMFDIVNIVIAEIQSRNETMENLVNLSQNGRKKVNDTNTTIQRISESSGNILKLIDFINGVSKQTNLLAINAAIESTHSGSEGKGFTVIADEIKNLSTMTANNAKQISKILNENVTDYKRAEKLGMESGDAFQFIAGEIHVVHGTIAEVVQSIQELKSRGGAILSKAKTLDAVAERVRDTSGEVYGEIVTINANLDEIQTLSNTIQNECEEIRSAQQAILKTTEFLKSQIQNIHHQTDQLLLV
ncbi:methyl-accepting chemotaxis protein [Leptospira biflexa]|jgi:methyl-accepting chemotaxis protein|uniref:methyl-accepting chemotaxis protein n=1 Tax=Leptospira biflexa TaxID=172 RepID=UPI00108433B8|nr:methyl-accepting chemotaxis protein [Leptospira biflexa]TGM32173.1 chemotaxis protein [Leptospira biflexa]TGM42151.1 chemotaxis protein [Leptospira biflexa]